jgi:hypothetical protein
MSTIDQVTTAFLTHHLHINPVEATFMGFPDHDEDLPPADREAPERERAALYALKAALGSAMPPNSPGESMDERLLPALIGHSLRNLDDRPRYRDPTWYTGETVFGLISLMLPSAIDPTTDALAGRIADIPRFLEQGQEHLKGQAAFSGWVARARKEVQVIIRLLQQKLPLHHLWRDRLSADIPAALKALAEFDKTVAAMPDADPRSGIEHLEYVMREVHMLPYGADEALDLAQSAIARALDDLPKMANAIDPTRDWQQQLADLNQIRPEPDQIDATYRAFHDLAMESSTGLLTPATEYGLEFKPFPEWSQGVYSDLYFLAYRCPPGANAGKGSVYWTHPPGQSAATIKSTHAVHHGSIGHHTQNARARVAPSRLARVVNQGVARGISFQAGGTMGEGWSCYVQDLMMEVPGFYSQSELLAARANELRNAACLVADIKFHTKAWDIEEMRRYYRDEAGFPAARLDFETVKNSLFPANRLMYWLGVEQIKSARAEWKGHTRDFHDGLIARGHVPLKLAIDDLFATA